MAIEVEEIMDDDEEKLIYSREQIEQLIRDIWRFILNQVDISNSSIRIRYCESEQVIAVCHHRWSGTTLNARPFSAPHLPLPAWDIILDGLYTIFRDFNFSKLEYQELTEKYRVLVSRGLSYERNR